MGLNHTELKHYLEVLKELLKIYCEKLVTLKSIIKHRLPGFNLENIKKDIIEIETEIKVTKEKIKRTEYRIIKIEEKEVLKLPFKP